MNDPQTSIHSVVCESVHFSLPSSKPLFFLPLLFSHFFSFLSFVCSVSIPFHLFSLFSPFPPISHILLFFLFIRHIFSLSLVLFYLSSLKLVSQFPLFVLLSVSHLPSHLSSFFLLQFFSPFLKSFVSLPFPFLLLSIKSFFSILMLHFFLSFSSPLPSLFHPCFYHPQKRSPHVFFHFTLQISLLFFFFFCRFHPPLLYHSLLTTSSSSSSYFSCTQ